MVASYAGDSGRGWRFWLSGRGTENAAQLEKSLDWSVIFCVCFASFFSLTLPLILPAWRISGGGFPAADC